MICNTEIDNRTNFEIFGVEELVSDFLEQLQYRFDTEVSIVFCDNSFIQELNLQYRHKDYATDVLSFPAELEYFLGDIVISLDKAKEQAVDSFEQEVEMLLCHGLLHLLGYDHELNEEEDKRMNSKQSALLDNRKKGVTIK
jgi:probable rRNA maturation factor